MDPSWKMVGRKGQYKRRGQIVGWIRLKVMVEVKLGYRWIVREAMGILVD